MKLENFKKYTCLRIAECVSWKQVEAILKKYHNLSIVINNRKK